MAFRKKKEVLRQPKPSGIFGWIRRNILCQAVVCVPTSERAVVASDEIGLSRCTNCPLGADANAQNEDESSNEKVAAIFRLTTNEEIAADSAMQVYTRPFVEATEPRGAQPLLKV